MAESGKLLIYLLHIYIQAKKKQTFDLFPDPFDLCICVCFTDMD